MASLVSQPRHSIKTYWARRTYQRLGSPSRRLKVARLGGGGRSAAGSSAASASSSTWRKASFRVARRAAALLAAPALLLARLRDAYVDAMVALGGSGAVRPCAALARSRSGAEAGLWDKRVPRARQGSRSGSKRGGGDFERRMMAHIYSMVVTPELPCAARA